MPEPDDEVGEHVRDVYAHFGLAYYMSQVLEHTLVNMITVAQLSRLHTLPAGVKTQDDLWSRNFALTLGRMVRQLPSDHDDTSVVAAKLSAAVETRNGIAHRFFRERAEDFLTAPGREAMIADLEAAREQFSEVETMLTAILRFHMHKLGVSAEATEREYAKLEQAAGSDL
ncbi:hypothetical protein [Frankia sp. Cr1]|uniref:hypothetical protein n=1 Tax=Frankia sp. Cr1 TaxID=3073931 RepID=UPI002AD4F732|nr:hypothetical protein [Frankia sp. Cr1]